MTIVILSFPEASLEECCLARIRRVALVHVIGCYRSGASFGMTGFVRRRC
jgi:hypothetical protein